MEKLSLNVGVKSSQVHQPTCFWKSGGDPVQLKGALFLKFEIASIAFKLIYFMSFVHGKFFKKSDFVFFQSIKSCFLMWELKVIYSVNVKLH